MVELDQEQGLKKRSWVTGKAEEESGLGGGWIRKR